MALLCCVSLWVGGWLVCHSQYSTGPRLSGAPYPCRTLSSVTKSCATLALSKLIGFLSQPRTRLHPVEINRRVGERTCQPIA